MYIVHTHTLARTHPKYYTLQENSSSKPETSTSNLGLPKIEMYGGQQHQSKPDLLDCFVKLGTYMSLWKKLGLL